MSGIVLPIVDFSGLKNKVQDGRFTSNKIQKFAVERISDIEETHEAISRIFREFQAGNHASKDLILDRIGEISHKCNEGFPISKQVKELDELEVLFFPIREKYQDFRNLLTKEERAKEEAKQLFLRDCGAKKSQLLRNEQEDFDKSLLFQAFLEKIKEKFSKATRKTIYFAYAWPTDSRYEKESWVQPFLKNLQAHLKKAGFPTVQLDIVSNRYGANIYEFMKRAKTSDFVLLFGTESLLDKFSKGISAVCTELIHILHKREEDGKENVHRVFPILLSGEHGSAFPPEYERFSTIRDWRDHSYLHNFQQLFLELLGLPPEDYLPKLRKYWREVLEDRPNETPPLSDWYQEQRKTIEACRRDEDRTGLVSVQVENFRASFTGRLKDHYITRSIIPILSFGEKGKWELTSPIESLYTKLVMITEEERDERRDPSTFVDDGRLPTHETIFKAKKEVTPEEIFKLTKGKRAVIYGSAGIGKTTFTTMLLYKWATEMPFTEFQIVLCIRLRNLTKNFYPKSRVYHAADILNREYESLGLDRIDSDPNTTLLILDGWDELPPETREGGHLAGAFQELQEQYPNLLITSRPGAIDVDATEFEILGFSYPEIRTYIDRFFHTDASKATGIKRFIRQNSLARSLAYIPINLSILCALYDQDDTLFNSETLLTNSALYDRIINQFYKIFLLREGTSQNEVRDRTLLSIHRDIEPIASCLEEIAYSAALKEGIYTDEREITRIVYRKKLEIEDIRKLGLFRIENSQGSFIHLTFQEYFAALYICRLYESSETKSQALEIVKSIKFQPKFARLLSMVAGVLSLAENRDALEAFFDDLRKEPRDLAEFYELTLFARCFDECQEVTRISQYEDFIESTVVFISKLPSKHALWRLIRNRHLINHPKIIALIKQFLKDPLHQASTLQSLTFCSSATYFLPKEIVDCLWGFVESNEIQMFGNPHFTACLVQIFGNIGGNMASTFLTYVFFHSILMADGVLYAACRAVGKLASNGQKIGKEIIRPLLFLSYPDDVAEEDEEEASFYKCEETEEYVSSSAIGALTKIIKSGQEFEDAEKKLHDRLRSKEKSRDEDDANQVKEEETTPEKESTFVIEAKELINPLSAEIVGEFSSIRNEAKKQKLSLVSVLGFFDGHNFDLAKISSIENEEKSKIEDLLEGLSEPTSGQLEYSIALKRLSVIPINILELYCLEDSELVRKCCTLTCRALVESKDGYKIFS